MLTIAHNANGGDLIQQTGGNCSIQIIGDNNSPNVLCPIQYVTKVITKIGHEREFRFLDARLSKLEHSLQIVEGAYGEDRQAVLAQLRTQNAALLEENAQLRAQTTDTLHKAASLQVRIDKIENRSVRQEAQMSLDRVELNDATAHIVAAETVQTEKNPLRGGPIVTTASDRVLLEPVCFQHQGCPRGVAGLAGGLFMSGTFAPWLVTPSASVVMGGGGDVIFGSTQIGDRNSFLFSLAARFGPRVRFGAPLGVSFGVYYDFPMVLAANGAAWFPLVGAAADIGIQYGLGKVSLIYRYDFVHLLYSSQSDLTFAGIGVTFINIHQEGPAGERRATFGD